LPSPRDPLKCREAGVRGHRPHVNTVYAKGKPRQRHRPQACVGCHQGCRVRYEDGIGNEVICAGSHFYKDAKTLDIQRKACDLLNKYGLNAYEMYTGELYLRALHDRNALGADTGPEYPLDFSEYGNLVFAEQLVKMTDYLYPFWRIPFDEAPRYHLDSGYGRVLGDRDINERCFYKLGLKRTATPEEIVRIYTDRRSPGRWSCSVGAFGR